MCRKSRNYKKFSAPYKINIGRESTGCNTAEYTTNVNEMLFQKYVQCLACCYYSTADFPAVHVFELCGRTSASWQKLRLDLACESPCLFPGGDLPCYYKPTPFSTPPPPQTTPLSIFSVFPFVAEYRTVSVRKLMINFIGTFTPLFSMFLVYPRVPLVPNPIPPVRNPLPFPPCFFSSLSYSIQFSSIPQFPCLYTPPFPPVPLLSLIPPVPLLFAFF